MWGFFMMVRIPGKLQKGDRIAIIPPAKAIDPAYVTEAIKHLNEWGLEVVLSENIYSKHHQYAGDDRQRIMALQNLLDSSEIRAILCARGGYGTTRIIDQLDFSGFNKHPKWIVGYSDITVLLARLYRIGISSIHGPMPVNFGDEGSGSSLERLKNLLFTGRMEPIRFDGNTRNRWGRGTGTLVGGNLSIIANCIGTPDELSTANRILFIEDVEEYYYRIDRMLVQLKRAGMLKNLSGLIIGHFTRMQDNDDPFGADIQDIVLDQVAEFDYPVCFGAPIGHEVPNFPVAVGSEVSLEVSDVEVVLKSDNLQGL